MSIRLSNRVYVTLASTSPCEGYARELSNHLCTGDHTKHSDAFMNRAFQGRETKALANLEGQRIDDECSFSPAQTSHLFGHAARIPVVCKAARTCDNRTRSGRAGTHRQGDGLRAFLPLPVSAKSLDRREPCRMGLHHLLVNEQRV